MKMMNLVRCVLSVLLMTSAITLVPACNTVEGAGKDIEKGGEKLKDAASDAK
jgi:predicted small secreted protein